MKTTKEQMKLNFDSFEFHAEEMRKMETKFIKEYDRIVGLEQWDELDDLLEIGETYRAASNKFLKSANDLMDQIPDLQATMKDKLTPAFLSSYKSSVNENIEIQADVHKKILTKIEMLRDLRDSGGYGSYE
jgi:hypothetical protein